ncbi:Protein ROS1 [Forsythia ovata]|uniref:Protein ROS1 n=1 Tax=Forsythia ovata TaxID=205694 RepID=A0ABD1U8N5_9LAMI
MERSQTQHGMLVTYEETLHLTPELQSMARGQLDKRTMRNFLDILAKELGSSDLEWLKRCSTPGGKRIFVEHTWAGTEKRGMCTPADTPAASISSKIMYHDDIHSSIDLNAGRIAVHLGWVPIQPLPEGEKFHFLKQYPKIDTVQKYLWPRLSKLDPLTMYELHRQMITLGKVLEP